MVKYKKYMLKHSSRVREDIEWTRFYSYDTTKKDKPRVLLIGDSICCGYEEFVRKALSGVAYVSYWATSRCVTDPLYLRELELVLDSAKYDCITFNNGLHSLHTQLKEWEEAYGKTLDYIMAKLRNVPLMTILSTPLKNDEREARVKLLNSITTRLSNSRKLPVLDLFDAMDGLDADRSVFWIDNCHFNENAREVQATLIANEIRKQLN